MQKTNPQPNHNPSPKRHQRAQPPKLVLLQRLPRVVVLVLALKCPQIRVRLLLVGLSARKYGPKRLSTKSKGAVPKDWKARQVGVCLPP